MTADQFISDIERRLRTARQVDVLHCEGLEPTTPGERAELAARLTKLLGQSLTAEMLRRLEYPRHVRVYWEHSTPERPNIFNGEVSLYNVADSLLEHDFSFLNYAENPDLEFLDQYRSLDDHPFIGDGYMTVIGLNEAFTDVNLFYRRQYTLHRLKLSFEEYLHCLTITMGYTHWQLLFCEDLEPEARDYVQNTYKQGLERDLRVVWPGIDLGELFVLAERQA